MPHSAPSPVWLRLLFAQLLECSHEVDVLQAFNKAEGEVLRDRDVGRTLRLERTRGRRDSEAKARLPIAVAGLVSEGENGKLDEDNALQIARLEREQWRQRIEDCWIQFRPT